MWSLVPKTSKMNMIGTKWVFENKMDVTIKRKELTMVKSMHLLQGLKQLNFCSLMFV